MMLVKVHAILWADGGVVVNEEHRQGELHLTLPGGRVLDREPLADALTREVAEELAARIRVGRLHYVAEVVHGHSVHDVILVFGAEFITPLSPHARVIDPESTDERVLPPILRNIAADGRDGPPTPRWLGNIWRSVG